MNFFRLGTEKTNWSDDQFLETYFNKRKIKRIDPACWKSHIRSFLNDLYSNELGEANDNKSHLALILMLPHPTKTTLLFEDYFNETGYDSDLPNNGEMLNITNTHHSMFFFHVQNCIRHSTEDKNFSELRAALGVIALVCLRSVGKPVNAISNFFLKEFQSTMNSLYPNLKCIKEFPLPSNVFFNKLPLRCDKTSSEISEILIFLVGMYTCEKKKNPQPDNAIISILNCCILQAIKLNGLGVISLLEKISHIYQVDVHTIIKLIYPVKPDSNESEDEPEDEPLNELDLKLKKLLEGCKNVLSGVCEITIVNEFYSKYMANDSLEISWPWCRLINDYYFQNCSIKVNTKSTLLAAIVSLKEPGIWNMSALKKKASTDPFKENAMKQAIKFDKLFR